MDHHTSPHVPYYGSFYITGFVSDLRAPFADENPYIESHFFEHASHDAFR